MSWNKLDRMRLESDVLETEIHEQDPERWLRNHEKRTWGHIAALAVLVIPVVELVKLIQRTISKKK